MLAPHEWIDLAMGLGSIAGLFGSGFMVYRFSKRDSHEQALAQKVQDHGERISHIEGFLNI